MKIYMLNPPYFPHFGRSARWQDTGRGGTLYYPIWLAYATALLEQRHCMKLVDAVARGWTINETVQDIIQFSPDLIVIDTSFPSLKNDIGIARTIKDSGVNAKIVIVGPPASQYAHTILGNDCVDYVARWEYDFILNELVFAIEEGNSIHGVKGISFKENGTILHNPDRALSTSEDLDTIPFVAKIYKKYLNVNDYFLGQSLYPEVQIFTGRGCPNNCTFCAWPQTLTGRTYRTRSLGNVLDEIEWIQNNLDVKEIFFEDDTFTLNKQRIVDFCKGYQERGLTIVWSCNARANTLDLETMKKMKKAHCRLLISGFESGSDSILKTIKKGITTEQIKEFSKNARKARLLVHGDFIIGLPGETEETVQATKKLIWEIKPDILQVAVASPFPGTEFYDWCKQNNYLLNREEHDYLDSDGHQKQIISYPGFRDQDIDKIVNSILKHYYVSFSYVPLVLDQILRKNGISELKRIIHSAKLFLGYIGTTSL